MKVLSSTLPVESNPDMSGIVCPGCAEVFPRSYYMVNRQRSDCPCGYYLWTSEVIHSGINVLSSAAALLDFDIAKSGSWYHSSRNEHWDAAFKMTDDTIIHAGTHDTALARANQLVHANLQYQHDAPVHVYELKIRKFAPLARRIMVDERTHASHGYMPGVQRYVNAYEDPGTISIMGNRWMFKVVGHEMFTQEEVEKNLDFSFNTQYASN